MKIHRSHFSNFQSLLVATLLSGVLVGAAHAATTLWTGASGVDTLWATPANWNPSPPGSGDTAIFNDTATVGDQFTVNNIVGADTTIAALSYTNSSAWHVTQIPAGTTLTVGGATVVGSLAAGGITTSAALVGEGTFVATGNMTLGNGSASSGSQAPGNLDLSGLATFVYNASAGTIAIGTLGSRSSGNLTLASGSNHITAGTININGATGTSSTPSFNVGAGTNIINVNTFNVGGGRSTTTLQFASGSGGLRMRGAGGTDSHRTTMTVGNRNTGGTATLITTGNVLFNGHPVDLKFATLTLGQMSRSQSGSDTGGYSAIGLFEFDQGVVDATTINLAVCSGNSTNSRATGTLTVGYAGELTVGTLSLGNKSTASVGTSATGTLNIQGGGSVTAGDMIKTTSLATTGIVTVANGSLSVSGSFGSASNPIDLLDVSDATLTLRAAESAPANVVTLTTGGSTNVINIRSLPSISAYPAQFQVIQYANAIGGLGFDNIGLGALPAGSPPFEGYLSNNLATLTIDLIVTNGPPPAQAIVWTGAQNGLWDTTTLNWLAGGVPTNYNNAGDFVTFNDTALTSTVHLVTETLTPGSLTVDNNVLDYTFTGSGKLSGPTGITKQGSRRLTLANSAANDFLGAISVEGELAFDQPVNATVANAISGPGSLLQNGPNTLILSGANSFSGGLTVNNGTLRTGHLNAPGSGAAVTVNSGGTLVLGAAHTNQILLAGGTLGTTVTLNPAPMSVTAAASTTSTLYIADPQNLLTPTDGIEVNFTNSWHGAGTVIVATVFNDPSPDGGNGFRLRGTNVSTFSGTLILSNRVKGELQTSVAGPFSPAGTGKIVLQGGVLTNNTLNGTYSELNLRNNSAGATVFGNDVVVAGTGLVVLDPLGSAPAGSTITMGNLRIGGGQELGVNLNGTGPDHPVVFQSVTLTGGDAAFSPKTPGWNTTPQIGSDLVLNNVGESAPSGIIMAGLRTLTLDGTCTYSGNTLVNSGTLNLAGTLSGGGTITVAGGVLAGNGSAAGNLEVNAAGTLTPGTSIGRLTVGGAVVLQGTNIMELDRSLGTNDVLQAGASITYGGTLILVNLGAPYQAGDSFKLFNAGSYLGAFSAVQPATPGPGLRWNLSALNTAGTITVASVQPGITNVVVADGNLTVSGGNGLPNGEYRVLTATDIGLPAASWTPTLTNVFDGNGGFSFTVPVNTSEPQRFFRLQAF